MVEAFSKDFHRQSSLEKVSQNAVFYSPIAIIDIGSNSVRLVIYNQLSRATHILYNEKILCALGRDIMYTKCLNKNAVHMALQTLKRFYILCTKLKTQHIHILATAAVREAKDGKDFLHKVQDLYKKPVSLLSGEEEAYYGALGIIASFSKAHGLMGDMGGGSLELRKLTTDPMCKGVTLPLGGLFLKDLAKENLNKAKEIAEEHIGRLSFWPEYSGGNFYAIGGIWRVLARLYMNYEKYPLKVIHSYEADAEKMQVFLKKILGKENKKSLLSENFAKKRRVLLPYGAIVLSEIIKTMHCKKIIFSSAGVRDGYLYAILPEKEQKKDVFLCIAKEAAKEKARFPEYGAYLNKWLSNSYTFFNLKEEPIEKRDREAICYLFDIFWRIPSGDRPYQSVEFLAYSLFYGIDHQSRAFIAISIFFINGGSLNNEKTWPKFSRLLSEEKIKQAKILACFIKLANSFSLLSPEDLPCLLWEKKEESFALILDKKHKGLYGEKPLSLLKALEKILERKLTINSKEK